MTQLIRAGKAGCAGKYSIFKGRRTPSGIITEYNKVAGAFDNLITDQGLNFMGDSGQWLRSCQVGDGNATPQVTDTALDNWVAGTQSYTTGNNTAQPSAPYYVSRVKTWRFTEGEATGNLQEVGVGINTDDDTLFSRALIVDGSGNPISITVLSDEFLDVVYEFRIYPPTTDVVGTITIAGIDYDYILRAAYVTNPGNQGLSWGVGANGSSSAFYLSSSSNRSRSGDIGPITSGPSGSNEWIQESQSSNIAYSNNSLEREAILYFPLTPTLTGIRSVEYSAAWGAYQIQFDPVVPKTSSNIFTPRFIHSWGRANIP